MNYVCRTTNAPAKEVVQTPLSLGEGNHQGADQDNPRHILCEVPSGGMKKTKSAPFGIGNFEVQHPFAHGRLMLGTGHDCFIEPINNDKNHRTDGVERIGRINLPFEYDRGSDTVCRRAIAAMTPTGGHRPDGNPDPCGLSLDGRRLPAARYPLAPLACHRRQPLRRLGRIPRRHGPALGRGRLGHHLRRHQPGAAAG